MVSAVCRRLLCCGDSNTYGYDPRSYLGGRYPESVRWTALLRGYGWDVINRGENGRSIPRGDGEIKAAVQSLCREEADILTVMLGIGFADAVGWGVDLAYDGVHFSEMGHLAFAKGIQQALTMLASKDRGD